MCEKSLDGKALMSIVAGTSVEKLQSMTDGTPRILRIMPNTPAMVYEGAFALCSDNDLKEDELTAAKTLYETIGIVEMVPEHLINAVCALSGGGPAYAAMFIEALADGGVKQGLPRATAYRLAAQTCLGTSKMILEKGFHPWTDQGHGNFSGRNHHRRMREAGNRRYAWCCYGMHQGCS